MDWRHNTADRRTLDGLRCRAVARCLACSRNNIESSLGFDVYQSW